MCEWYEQHIIEPILASLEEFQEHDSGWALSRILNLTINVKKSPARRMSHRSATRNSDETSGDQYSFDGQCVSRGRVAVMYPAEKCMERESSYPHDAAVNLVGIKFPITLKDISKFERLNAVSINVYGIENELILPIWPMTRRRSTWICCSCKIYATIVSATMRGSTTCPILWTRRLVRKRARSFSGTGKYNKKSQQKEIAKNDFFICKCLHYFSSGEKLQSHKVDCQKINDCAIQLPNENNRCSNSATITTGNECRSSSTSTWNAFYTRRSPTRKTHCRTHIK